ncbi:lactonase family protein [Bacillus atrophaeus]|uniref:lactonase family protein n=1 Tax=Bacillus atrophaeus TaxID=1452 RepID=UPI00123B48C2|nr:lactonase family protein [Bacillus atrophaeus]KAA6453876.1 6-phosphogluconolactonase [Bacillus atrophaeus]MCY8512328.1 lactonase family protein [Bacillus atrophaeus]MCY8992985.1 lactonase family protein [Bacillus atrophaeus]
MTKYIGYIGTYTKGGSEGIYSFELDTEKKTLSQPKTAAKLGNPTYVTPNKENSVLYSIVKADGQGGVAAYQIDPATGDLTLLNQQLIDGPSPCHVSVDDKNQFVLTANYHSGKVHAFPVLADGSLEQAVTEAAHSGTGPHERQEKPHTHYAGFTPEHNYVVAVDLGTDKLYTYQLKDGELKEVSTHSFAPGAGPRHIAFHPKEKYAYIMTELSNEVIALEYDPTPGEFREIQVVSALPDDFTDNSQGSAIHVSKDGRFVYAANRGHDSIAVFKVNQYSGELAFVERTSTEGSWPRDFAFDPSEKFLVASNEETGNLVLFERDEETGRLTLIQSDVSVPYPVCVKFLQQA